MADFLRRRELDFLLYELLDTERLLDHDAFAHLDRSMIDNILDTAHRIADEQFASHARDIDENEPEFDGEDIVFPDYVKDALRVFGENGFIAGPFPTDAGGMGLPYTVVQAYSSMFHAANIATSGFGLLTIGAANLLHSFGTSELKHRYLGAMLEGRFTGTMALSEPDAGSALGDLRTAAHEQPDGTYRIVGNKMWISGAGHEMSENIVHLVLARIDDAPAGSRGISLFLVPRYLVNDDGSRGERNDVRVAGVNHKMGYRGITNTVLNFGEDGGAVGWLIGEPHRGLSYMFQMMNEARIGVGLGSAMSAHAAYLFSLDYAKERKQGRHPDERDPALPPVAIIEHADVRRMLLKQRAYIEPAWALCLYCATLVDKQHVADEEAANEAKQLLDILTPIAKAWPAEFCLKANELAIQVLGGYGYSREYPVERHYRDNRLNAIHEGTNGIQALDLLGRKVTMDGGAAYRALSERIAADAKRLADDETVGEYAATLLAKLNIANEVTMQLGAVAMEGRVRAFLANAHPYLELLGHVVMGWMWLRQAEVAARALESGSSDFYEGKLQTCRFYFRWELPLVDHRAEILRAMEDTPLRVRPETL